MRVKNTLFISVKIRQKNLAFSIKILYKLPRKKFLMAISEIPQKVTICV
jgi:hypothetical protein